MDQENAIALSEIHPGVGLTVPALICTDAYVGATIIGKLSHRTSVLILESVKGKSYGTANGFSND